MIWNEFLRHFRFCEERKGPKNRPKHTRKRIHQAKKNFLEKFKTASKTGLRSRDKVIPVRPRYKLSGVGGNYTPTP